MTQRHMTEKELAEVESAAHVLSEVDGDLPQYAVEAASFAESLARKHELQGGNPRDLFVAIVGLVSARDRIMGAEFLRALDDVLVRMGGEVG